MDGAFSNVLRSSLPTAGPSRGGAQVARASQMTRDGREIRVDGVVAESRPEAVRPRSDTPAGHANSPVYTNTRVSDALPILHVSPYLRQASKLLVETHKYLNQRKAANEYP